MAQLVVTFYACQCRIFVNVQLVKQLFDSVSHGEFPRLSLGDERFKLCLGMLPVTIRHVVHVIKEPCVKDLERNTVLLLPNAFSNLLALNVFIHVAFAILVEKQRRQRPHDIGSAADGMAHVAAVELHARAGPYAHAVAIPHVSGIAVDIEYRV